KYAPGQAGRGHGARSYDCKRGYRSKDLSCRAQSRRQRCPLGGQQSPCWTSRVRGSARESKHGRDGQRRGDLGTAVLGQGGGTCPKNLESLLTGRFCSKHARTAFSRYPRKTVQGSRCSCRLEWFSGC